jgi:hypothetical protein
MRRTTLMKQLPRDKVQIIITKNSFSEPSLATPAAQYFSTFEWTCTSSNSTHTWIVNGGSLVMFIPIPQILAMGEQSCAS